jgi:hypothetical protein
MRDSPLERRANEAEARARTAEARVLRLERDLIRLRHANAAAWAEVDRLRGLRADEQPGQWRAA